MYCRVCSGRKFSSDAGLFSAAKSSEAAASTKSASWTDLESGAGDGGWEIGDGSSSANGTDLESDAGDGGSEIGDGSRIGDCPDKEDIKSLLPKSPLSRRFRKSPEFPMSSKCPKSPLAGVGSPSNSNTPVRQCQNSGADCSIELSQGRDTHSNRVDSHICRFASMSLK